MILVYSLWPSGSGRSAARPAPAFKEDMPNRAVVQRLAAVLNRGRRSVPALAAQRIDRIEAQLPLLESRLASLDPLDPLAQDARRLMGQHLPELIERYGRVPQTMRSERDGAG